MSTSNVCEYMYYIVISVLCLYFIIIIFNLCQQNSGENLHLLFLLVAIFLLYKNFLFQDQ